MSRHCGDFLVCNLFRIQGGIARGRKLSGPPGYRFRPTTGRVKAFIFNYLGDEVKDARILDLFSGSGSLGIEALSRGAREIFFIEQSYRNVTLIKKNLNSCRFSDNARVFKGDVFSIIKRMGQTGNFFDFVLADPPFKALYRTQIIKGVGNNHLLRADGLLIVEHDVNDPDSGEHDMKLIRQRRFGQSMISIYCNREAK